MCKIMHGNFIDNNMEKLLKLLSDEQLVDDLLQAVQSFIDRKGSNPDIEELKDKIKNIKQLLKPIDYGKSNSNMP